VGRAPPPEPEEPFPQHRDGVDGEGDGHERVERPARTGDGGVEEHEAVDRLRGPRGLQDRDHPAHRVAHEDHRRAGHLAQEAVEDLDVVVHRRPAVTGLAAAEAGQVEREDAGVRAQQGREEVPVQVRAAQTVHEHHRRRLLGSAEVDVVDRATEIDRPALTEGVPLRLGHASSSLSSSCVLLSTVTRR